MVKNLLLIIAKRAYIAIPVAVSLLLAMYAYGCEPKTRSLLDPAQRVSAQGLAAELELLQKTYNIRSLDLQRQIQFREMIFNQAIIIAETGTVNPLGVITSIMAILGFGAIGDDIRIRRKLKAKSPIPSTHQ